MTYPYLTIDLDRIERNARTVAGLCAAHGVAVMGVTKAVRGDPGVARAMVRGGVSTLGDSRLDNLRRLRQAGLGVPLTLLRLPPLSGVDAVVEAADTSLNSEPAVLEGLSRAASARGRIHEVVLMVELGDLREGLLPNDVVPVARRVAALPGLRLVGLGTNLSCLGGVVPTPDNMGRLVALAGEVEAACGLPLRWISGMNSSGLELLGSGHLPRRVNHARIGEAILLGRETIGRKPWPGTAQDAFTLHAEVLELKRKPSRPTGAIGEDAFGHVPHFKERGEILRALLNIGRQDADIAGLAPRDGRLSILGATSDYLAMDVSAAADTLRVGDEIAFDLNYAALLAAMTSEYVEKVQAGAESS